MKERKTLMAQAAMLYYKNNYTQQEVAEMMGLTRQTVSKLLAEAVENHVVEIKINNPDEQATDMKRDFAEAFNVKAIICPSAGNDVALRQFLVAERAAEYLSCAVKHGGKRIGLSWGRMVSATVQNMTAIATEGNMVFPLLGATNDDREYFLPNELARELADKLSARVKYAWFPCRPDSEEDAELLAKTSYYKSMQDLWSSCDVAVMGIGNNKAFTLLDPNGVRESRVVGDVAMHFFDKSGKIIDNSDSVLRISYAQLQNAGEKIGIVSGDDKIEAIIGALRTGLIDTLITDEYTAKAVLEY